MKRATNARPIPPPPTVPELVQAPELAAVTILEHTLDVVREALLAEHPTLVDDFHRPREQGRILASANRICLRAAALRDMLGRYRCALRDAAAAADAENVTDDDDGF